MPFPATTAILNLENCCIPNPPETWNSNARVSADALVILARPGHMPDLAPFIGRKEKQPAVIGIIAAKMMHMLNRSSVEPDEIPAIRKLNDDMRFAKTEMVGPAAL